MSNKTKVAITTVVAIALVVCSQPTTAASTEPAGIAEKAAAHADHHDDVSSYRANADDLMMFAQAQEAQSRFPVPLLFHAKKTHEYLFVALFDCSWRNAPGGPAGDTNLKILQRQLTKASSEFGGRVHGEYVETDCARDNWFLQKNSSIFDTRVKEMYRRLSGKVAQWKRDDSEAQIRLAVVGAGWGAEQAASFTRWVDRQGIAGEKEGDEFLVSPGETAQVVGLFDPVGAVEHDLRLPPSVISGFQITAKNELRVQFESVSIIDPGMTPDGRVLGVAAPGSHADVTGGYRLNGLSNQCFNLMAHYLNALSDTAYLSKLPMSVEYETYVIHRSGEERFLRQSER